MPKNQTAYKIKLCANTMSNYKMSHTQRNRLILIIDFSLQSFFKIHFMFTVIGENFCTGFSNRNCNISSNPMEPFFSERDQ